MRLALACLLSISACYVDDPPGSAPDPAPDAGVPVVRQRPRDPRRPEVPPGERVEARDVGAASEHVQRARVRR